jgi:hypothetical protein
MRKELGSVDSKDLRDRPLTCPKCVGIMRIISFIEDPEVIKAILKHLGLWLTKSKPSPKAHAQPAGCIRDSFFQFPCLSLDARNGCIHDDRCTLSQAELDAVVPGIGGHITAAWNDITKLSDLDRY